jgi:hypothetical protein
MMAADSQCKRSQIRLREQHSMTTLNVKALYLCALFVCKYTSPYVCSQLLVLFGEVVGALDVSSDLFTCCGE